MVTDKLSTCRLVEDEISYLDNYWCGKFSDYVHSSIKRDIVELENNKKKYKALLFKEFSQYVVIMGLGIVFFLFGLNTTGVFQMAISYVLGLFMVVFGVVGGLLIALQSTKK